MSSEETFENSDEEGVGKMRIGNIMSTHTPHYILSNTTMAPWQAVALLGFTPQAGRSPQ